MSAKYIVGYDSSAGSRRAVDFAVMQAGTSGASVLIVHVLEWSPYSFLTPQELEERHQRRKDELARAEEAVLSPLMKELSGTSVNVESQIKYGHIAETLSRIAKEESGTQLFIGREGDSSLSAKIFGSVAGSLAQVSPVPLTIVP
ncbi:universal stress protein [Tepidamorphus sp. 3E244]|uniref:universal stress protein n=1 Tax=Tepidamorphus sp. 3E244 TaxID=3385498 RepID=UPI0038FCE3CF